MSEELREKIARVLFDYANTNFPWHRADSVERSKWYGRADAILAIPEIKKALEAKK